VHLALEPAPVDIGRWRPEPRQNRRHLAARVARPRRHAALDRILRHRHHHHPFAAACAQACSLRWPPQPTASGTHACCARSWRYVDQRPRSALVGLRCDIGQRHTLAGLGLGSQAALGIRAFLLLRASGQRRPRGGVVDLVSYGVSQSTAVRVFLAGRVAAELQLAGCRLAAGTRAYLQVRFTGCAATSPAACTTATSTANTTAVSRTTGTPLTSSTVAATWSPDEPHLPARLRVRSD
jgi:hypothetical protein